MPIASPATELTSFIIFSLLCSNAFFLHLSRYWTSASNYCAAFVIFVYSAFLQIVIISTLLLNKTLKLLNIHSLIYFFSSCQSKICYKCDKTNHFDLEKVCFISKNDLFPIIIFTLISASL